MQQCDAGPPREQGQRDGRPGGLRLRPPAQLETNRRWVGRARHLHRAENSSWPLAIFCAIFCNGHPEFDLICIKLYRWPIKISFCLRFGRPNPKPYFSTLKHTSNKIISRLTNIAAVEQVKHPPPRSLSLGGGSFSDSVYGFGLIACLRKCLSEV